jgi:DNA repair protein RadC
VSAAHRQRQIGALVRTLRENGRLLALLARWCEADRLTPSAPEKTFRQPGDVAAYLGPEMAGLPQEQLRVVLLDRRGRLIDAVLIYQGGQTEIAVRLLDCFRQAVRHNAAAIILVHNHPSGDPTPSDDDVQLTRDAGQAGRLLGIHLLDHIVLATDGFVSLRAVGLYVLLPEDADESRLPVDIGPTLPWGYDCSRCGASVQSLDFRAVTCQRCLAPVICRAMPSVRPVRPAAA